MHRTSIQPADSGIPEWKQGLLIANTVDDAFATFRTRIETSTFWANLDTKRQKRLQEMIFASQTLVAWGVEHELGQHQPTRPQLEAAVDKSLPSRANHPEQWKGFWHALSAEAHSFWDDEIATLQAELLHNLQLVLHVPTED